MIKELVTRSAFGLLLVSPSSGGLAVRAQDSVPKLPTQSVSQSISEAVPMVISTGAVVGVPANSTESTVFTLARHTDFVRIDVDVCRDGIPFAVDTLTLNRDTDVARQFPDRRGQDSRWRVSDLSSEELRQLNWIPTAHGNVRMQFRLRTLREHLTLISAFNRSQRREAGIAVILAVNPMTGEDRPDAALVVLNLLAEYGYSKSGDRAFVLSRDFSELKRLRTEHNCRLALTLVLAHQPTPQQLAEYARVCDAIAVPVSAILDSGGSDADASAAPSLVQTAHQHALQVHVVDFDQAAATFRPVESSSLLDRLVRTAGVDAVITANPDAVIAWRNDVGDADVKRGPFRLLKSRSKTAPP